MFHVMFWIRKTKKCFSGVPSNDLSRYDPLSGYVWAKSESREGQSADLIKYLLAWIIVFQANWIIYYVNAKCHDGVPAHRDGLTSQCHIDGPKSLMDQGSPVRPRSHAHSVQRDHRSSPARLQIYLKPKTRHGITDITTFDVARLSGRN